MTRITNRARILCELVALKAGDRTRLAVEAAAKRCDNETAVKALEQGRVKFGALSYKIDELRAELDAAAVEEEVAA